MIDSSLICLTAGWVNLRAFAPVILAFALFDQLTWQNSNHPGGSDENHQRSNRQEQQRQNF
jgi:hypothetical protein